MSTSVYRTHLGTAFDRLPEAVRRFHSLAGRHRLSGTVSISGAESLVGRLLALCAGLPPSGPQQEFAFELDARPDRELWVRCFPGRTMRSVLAARGDWLCESFGPIRLWFKLEAREDRLLMHLHFATFAGLRLPAFLYPRVRAEEYEADGHFHFDVDAYFPGRKLLVAYKGRLSLDGVDTPVAPPSAAP